MSSNIDIAPGFFIGVILTGMVAFIIGACLRVGTDEWWRDELVRRGHAIYYLDEHHNRQWNWKETEPK